MLEGISFNFPPCSYIKISHFNAGGKGTIVQNPFAKIYALISTTLFAVYELKMITRK